LERQAQNLSRAGLGLQMQIERLNVLKDE